ncbi:hypothetical protein [Flavobacterium notoginsengisoli]|uniref:hypothetical protein n=1 Tax=Flavobacterium notoginsengisoli TaxID=1478199 RepID=UPI00363DDE6F
MYHISKNLNRLEIGVINSFEKRNNDLKINFALVKLANFIEGGYQNKISFTKSDLLITNIFSESFYFNKNQEKTHITNIENEYYITDFKKIIETKNCLELEIVTWKNNQPYNENDDTDFIIWKIKAGSFELRWNGFTYW